MAGFRVELPTIQNWSCHNCGGCCRQHQIEITDEEKRRIESQNWTAADGVPAGQPLFQTLGRKRYALAHQSDGGCVFLDERGLCRIHAKFGEDAKPLACRIYPYAFHPAGNVLTVSLRFSCPSVVANRGTPVDAQRKSLDAMARLVAPADFHTIAPPAVSTKERLDWDDTLRVVAAMHEAMTDEEIPFVTRLLRTVFWTQLLGNATFEKVRGDRLDELLQILHEASAGEVPENLTEIPLPSAVGRMHFRMLAAQYARKDTAADVSRGWRHRLRLFRAAMRFARGSGMVPPLQEGFREVPFTALEPPSGGLPEGGDELFTRYFEVKILGMHFCGRGFYDAPVVEGFLSLALVFPVTMWLARWLAASESATSLTLDHLQRALAVADHHHGYAPALGDATARRRMAQLRAKDEILRLCAWYAR